MGNKLSCNCGPLTRTKPYRFEDTPWSAGSSGRSFGKRDGHLLRLWAEVFHVSSAGGGTVKWQQVSEDLVPVNITCIQDSPEVVFHITAYNSQVDKILDVRLVQPGTRIGQASECFVYWKDPVTSDTWGLNFTSPIDAKQFRECCSPAFKFSRKASSSYSLRLDNSTRMGAGGVGGRGGFERVGGSRGGSGRINSTSATVGGRRRPLSTPTSPSKTREPQCTCMTAEQYARLRAMDPRFRAASTLPRSALTQQASTGSMRRTESRGTGTEIDQDGVRRGRGGREIVASKSVDYSDAVRDSTLERRKARSKSTEDVTVGQVGRRGVTSQQQQTELILQQPPYPTSRSRTAASKSTIGTNTTPTGDGLDSHTLKRLLKPMPSSSGSAVTSPETCHRIYHHDGYISEPEIRHASTLQGRGKRMNGTLRKERSRGVGTQTGYGKTKGSSPPDAHPAFDHAYYATTPPSSSPEEAPKSPSGSPTARLLLEYEQHLRNTLAKGMDAESYSLHTFEAIISQSNENLAVPQQINSSRSTTLPRFFPSAASRGDTFGKQVSRESRDSDVLSGGYSSDFRDRGYLSDHNSRSSGIYDRHEIPQRSGYYSDREGAAPRSGYYSDREISAHSKYGSVRQQASVESTDSRLCYLTSSEISDDERMSLTTAVSDDEPGDGGTSPSRGSRKPAASFNCTGAVRKAGFLSVKKWLLRKRHQVELARRRGWKGYWVCLKGTTLLFYPCDARETRTVEAAPKHLIIVDGAIMQPIPEHPKRDYIFCLSTAFGDAYLFQAPCQVELESWVHSIHWACAAAFARHRGKTGTLHLLQEEIMRLDKAIESDGKLRHMGELQRSVVADPETRQQLAQQILNWEENIERLHCEQFRLRCYMASLQGGELPNPKSLLSHVSRTTKNILNRLGVFTVSSFHAFVCARSPSLLSNLLAGRGATKRRAPLLSRSNSASSRRSLHSSMEREPERSAKVSLPDNQIVTVPLKDAMSVEEFLITACARKNLAPMEHFLRVKKRRDLDNYFVPHRSDLVDTYLVTHEVVEVRAKLLYQVELGRGSLDQMWGFSVEAELVENADRQDELCCYVSRVEERSVAMNNGIIKSDEILVINGAIVSDLDMMYIESVLQEELSLCLMLRSSRTEAPLVAASFAAADVSISHLICPPPPADPLILSDDVLSQLIVPAPHESKNKDLSPSDTEDVGHLSGGETRGGSGRTSRADSTEIETLLKTAEQVTGICRTKERTARLIRQQSSGGPGTGIESSPVISGGSSPTHPYGGTPVGGGLRDVEKMKKVVLELVTTEKAYVKHLTGLLEQYLEPLRNENFLSAAEMMAIFGNIREMVTVQRRFLRSLESALETDVSTPLESITHPSEFKLILSNIASAFLQFADHFKLYSSFCASHSKAQKLLHPTEGNQALQQFLQARNPRQQHSHTLESYLIKPIQRILKYPLLLQQLRNLCDTNTEEYRSLVEALQCMERVAEHINEMQRIHEEYGAIFEHLYRQHQKQCKAQVDLSPGDLLHYGGVEWLNIADFLGKIKKGLELHAMCFVFKSAVVFLCKERLRHKKKLMGAASKSADKSEVEIIRYQVLIPVSEVQVRQIGGDSKDGSTIDLSGPNYSWELVHLRNQAQRRSEKIYLLSNSTAEFRNAFLKNIRQIIRESVRNMSLPPRLPPDSAGGSGQSSHYATPEGSDVSFTSHKAQAQTLGRKKPPKPPQRHSAGNLEMGSARLKSQESSDSSSAGFRAKSRTLGFASGEGSRSKETDSEEGGEPVGTSGGGAGSTATLPSRRGIGDVGIGGASGSTTMPRAGKGMLGATPNHLTLSTASTLSTGSTGSAAKLIQSSGSATKFPSAPPPPEPSSPVWKPREEGFTSATLPRKADSQSLSSTQSESAQPKAGTSKADSENSTKGSSTLPTKKGKK